MMHDRKVYLISFFVFILAVQISAQNQYFLYETDSRLPHTGLISTTADVADIDGDGDIDIIADAWDVFPPFNPYYLFINDGTGIFTQESFSRLPDTSFSSEQMGFVDVDADGDYDAYIGSEGEDMLFINDGDGYFDNQTQARLPSLVCDNIHFLPADLSGDMAWDLMPICLYQNGHNHYLLNNSTGHFIDVTDQRMPADTLFDLFGAVGDFDNDLDLDLFFAWITNSSDLHIRGLENINGYFVPFEEGRLPDRFARWMELADIDNDGDLDIVISGLISVGILINYDGIFRDETNQRITINVEQGVNRMGLGDFDDDGDIDIIAPTAPDGHCFLYLNDGNGYFTQADGRIPDSVGSYRWVQPFDADGDGDLDAFVACSGDGQQSILINYSTPDTIPPKVLASRLPQGVFDTAASEYPVKVSAYDNISVEKGALRSTISYRVNGGSFQETMMTFSGGTIFYGVIPRQPDNSFIEYYITLNDRMHNLTLIPSGAPDSLYSFLVSGQSIIGGDERQVPAKSTLSAYPNPFNSSVSISYFLKSDAHASIDIFNISGQRVASLFNGNIKAGNHEIVWDASGFASGEYFVRLKTGEIVRTERITLLK